MARARNLRRRAFHVACGMIGGILSWYFLTSPRLDRDWAPEHAVAPVVTFDGDLAHVRGVRDFRFSDDGPPTGVWDDRTYDLSRIATLWYGVAVFDPEGWRGPAHSLFSFGFEDGSYVAVSVEARKEIGEGYSIYRGMLRSYELIYVIAPGLIPPTWRVVLPGYSDELMASLDLLAGDQDLAGARRRHWINDRAAACGDGPGFSDCVRETTAAP